MRLSRRKTPMSVRRLESEQAYQRAKHQGVIRPLNEEPVLINYKHWFLIANRFPYDMIYAEHDLLVCKRQVARRDDLSIAELIELNEAINELENQYHLIFENTMSRRSIKNHYHLHLARYVDDRSKITL